MADDLELFERWSQGDVDAGQALVLRHYDAVYLFFATKVAEHLAAELTQDTFETMCMKVDRLHLHSSFAAYLFGIARWKLVELHRHRSKDGFDPISDSLHLPGAEPTLSTLISNERDMSRLVQALRRLPLDDQILLELRIHEALRLREIAEILGVSLDRVSTRLATAKRRLQRAMGDESSTEEGTLTSFCSYMEGIHTEHVLRIERAEPD